MLGCSESADGPDFADGTGGDTGTVMATSSSTGTCPNCSTSTDGTTVGLDGTTAEPPDIIWDLKSDVGEMAQECRVVGRLDAVGACDDVAPPDAFEPDIQWEWTPAQSIHSTVTPLVANLTDDNDDGVIDLCDTPDIVVVTYESLYQPADLHVLDGATGAEHYVIEDAVDFAVTPALGDIDGDGMVEIISARPGDFMDAGVLVAFEHDGTLKWEGDTPWVGGAVGAVALADLDNDGDVEILAGGTVSNHDGTLAWSVPVTAPDWAATTAADLDDDGTLELVLGHAAYDWDGDEVYLNLDIAPGFPQVADLDDDPEPEVLISNAQGMSLLNHDGSTIFADLRPTGDPVGPSTWLRPATVHDFDGDGLSEFAMSSADHYSVFTGAGDVSWSAVVSDQSGVAAGTAFDFLGDGIAEAMYADEHNLFVFDGAGVPLLTTQRTSATGTEYPVVADVDNDGSAEIVVVSNGFANGATVQVVRDVQDRWIQARRIWNQHTYHVTNVREDGTIPTHEQPNWTLLNTFRTNAQIQDGSVCKPEPEG
ncbi:MAG: VCBS repeat-containing protein [Myxococcota bacterium]